MKKILLKNVRYNVKLEFATNINSVYILYGIILKKINIDFKLT